ncbi:MAG TPA: hypothetical protein VMW50_05030 [Dehalococcoidia bacterium]|nr:hypothetical protein [Dehalococcoidia bacterium]
MPYSNPDTQRVYMRDLMRKRRTQKVDIAEPLVIPPNPPAQVQRPPVLLWVALAVAIVFFALAVISVYY